jgi:hypothetical protein
MTKKILNATIKEMLKIRLYSNSKLPFKEDWQGKNEKNYSKNYQANKNYNIGIPTGKVNNCIVLDLDTYKWTNEHPFYILYDKETFIKEIDTFTAETGRKGNHLFFEYDKDIKNVVSKKYNIDVFTNNKYIVGAGSVVNGNTYKIINNVDIKPLPQKLKDFILELQTENKTTTTKRTTTTTTEKEKINYDFKLYYGDNVKFSDDEFNEIIKNLPNEYINDLMKWLNFTKCCIVLNKKDIWDKVSSKSSSYNYDNNNKIWDRHTQNTKEENLKSLLHILKVCKSKLGQSIKYTPIQKSDMVVNKYYNRKHLGGKNYDAFNSQNSIVCKSDTGTGKTTQTIEYLKKWDIPFISIVDRITLSISQYDTFNKKGLETQHYTITGIEENKSCIICINSLATEKYNIGKFDFKNTILFTDEITATLNTTILCPTLQKNRMVIFYALRSLIKECKQVIAVDADINDIVVDWFKSLRNDIKLIVNKVQHNKNVKATELNDEKILLKKLRKEKKFILCCDSAKKAKSIFKKLNDPSITLITDADITDINKYVDLDKFDKVIYSPKIIRGIDSQMKRRVYVYYMEHTISPDDMLQQFTRCRNITELFFIFTKKAYKSVPTYAEYCEEVNKTNEYAQNKFNFIKDNLLSEYLELYKKLSYRKLCYNSNKYIHFVKLLSERGFKVYQNFNKTKINSITKEERNDILQDYINIFDIESKRNKTLNEKYLKIPLKTIENNKNVKELFIDNHKLTKHFNICSFLYTEDNKLLVKLEDRLDYKINKFTSSINKIRFVKELYEVLNIDFDNLNIDINNIDNEKLKTYEEKYNNMFRDRSKNDFIKDIQKIIIKISKNLFGNDLIKSKQQPKNENGERPYNYFINRDVLEYHNFIYSFRKPQDMTKRIF